MSLDQNVDADMGALVAARTLEIGNSIFKNVPLGGTFRFANSTLELRKVSFNRYSDGTATYSTGQRAAVFR
jgi:hypothetical protein